MTTEFKPRAAFRAYAAKVLKARPEDLDGGAIDLTSAKALPNNIGEALAYTMWAKTDADNEVRGWVTIDGTVITPEQNLGRLFTEAGLWSKTPLVPPREFAKELMWWYGTDNQVAIDLNAGMAGPKLTLEPDGSGTYQFFSSYRQPGPGGAGGGPRSYYEFKVALTADHKATLTKRPFQPSAKP